MRAWLVSSFFLSHLSGGGEILSTSRRAKSGPVSAAHHNISSMDAGDVVLPWDLLTDSLSRVLVVTGDCTPGDGPTDHGMRIHRKLVTQHASLPDTLGRDWLTGFNDRHLDSPLGFKLFRSTGGHLQFTHRKFCREVPLAALAEIVGDAEGLVAVDQPRRASSDAAAIPSRGPGPYEGPLSFERTAEGPGHCYLLRFGDTDTWKVGYASDHGRRLCEINLHMPRGTGLGWRLVASNRFPSLHDAYVVEQATLAEMAHLSVGGEQFRGTETEIMAAWSGLARSQG